MRQKQILAPIAVTLSQTVWTPEHLERALKARLPRPLSRIAAPLARRLIRQFPLKVPPDPHLIRQFLAAQPETRRLIAFGRRHNLRPDPVLEDPQFLPDPSFAHLDLPQLTTPADLAEWLAISPEELTRFADLRGLSARSDDPFGPHYRCHLHEKTNGDLRLIEEPRPFLKRLHRRILMGILDQIPAHPAAMGFCKGRSAVQGAARHAGEALVISFDLADFFPAIDTARLYGVFRALGYPQPVARPLSGLVSAITPPRVLKTPGLAAAHHLATRHLPQGAPTSPALANAAAYRLDCRLAGLARSMDATYTRYADDLTFSGDPHIEGPLQSAIPQIVQEEGFALNLAKTRAMPAHRRQSVTGITVNRKTNLRRSDFDRLKATIHHLKTKSDPRRNDIRFLTRLSGQIAWAEALNPMRGHKLRTSFNAVLDARG